MPKATATRTVILSPDGTELTDPGVTESLILLVSELPDAEDDDGQERVLAQLLAAESPEDLNRPWVPIGIEQQMDTPFQILRVTRRPSDFQDGIGVYVLIHAIDVRSGEPVVRSTGSINIIAQLIMAHTRGWLPLTAIPRGPKRPKPGRKGPYRLEFVAGAAIA